MTKESVNPNVPGGSKTSSASLSNELGSLPSRDALQEFMLGFADLVEKNKAIVIAAVALVVVGGLAAVGWDVYSKQKEKSALEALYTVEKPYTERREKLDQAKFAALSASAGQDVKLADLVKAGTAIVATGDLAKDYGTIVDALEAFASKNVGTSAAIQASLMAAETRLQYNQADRALAGLDESVRNTKPQTLMGALSRMASGNALAASGKCDQALQQWEAVIAAKEQAFLHSEAALRSGICFEKSGDKPKAIEMYRKASAESEKSSSAQTARSLLRALELGT